MYSSRKTHVCHSQTHLFGHGNLPSRDELKLQRVDEGDDKSCKQRVKTNCILKVVSRVGDSVPPHATASGVMMASHQCFIGLITHLPAENQMSVEKNVSLLPKQQRLQGLAIFLFETNVICLSVLIPRQTFIFGENFSSSLEQDHVISQ